MTECEACVGGTSEEGSSYCTDCLPGKHFVGHQHHFYYDDDYYSFYYHSHYFDHPEITNEEGNPECIDCRSKEAEGEEEEEEETNAVCRKCQLSFFTASGKQECLDCRAVEADEDKEDEEDDEGEGEETTADSSLAVSPDVSPAADQLELQQKQQHKQQRGKQRGKQRKALADATGCNLHAVAAQMMA